MCEDLKTDCISPFNVPKRSILKGLKLCVHKSTGNKYFVINFWYDKKQNIYSVGKFNLGLFGTSELEAELTPIVEEHTNKKRHWIKALE